MVDEAASTEADALIASTAEASTDFHHEDAVTIAEKASMAAAHVSAARLHANKAAATAAAEASPPQPASAIDDVAAAAVHEGEPVAAG